MKKLLSKNRAIMGLSFCLGLLICGAATMTGDFIFQNNHGENTTLTISGSTNAIGIGSRIEL